MLPRTFIIRGLILVAAFLLLLPLQGKAQAQTVRKSGTPRYSSTRYAPAPRTTACRRTAGGGDIYQSDPFGYRQTEDLIIPGLGTKRRGAQCTPVRRTSTASTVRGPATYIRMGSGAAEGDYSHYLSMLQEGSENGNGRSLGGDTGVVLLDPGMPLPGVRCDEEFSLLPKTGVDLPRALEP